MMKFMNKKGSFEVFFFFSAQFSCSFSNNFLTDSFKQFLVKNEFQNKTFEALT